MERGKEAERGDGEMEMSWRLEREGTVFSVLRQSTQYTKDGERKVVLSTKSRAGRQCNRQFCLLNYSLIVCSRIFTDRLRIDIEHL